MHSPVDYRFRVKAAALSNSSRFQRWQEFMRTTHSLQLQRESCMGEG